MLADFFILLWSTWWQAIQPWKFLRNWAFITIKRTKKSRPRQKRIYVTCKLEKQSLGDFSIVAGTTVLKLLFIVVIFLKMSQKFRNNFLEENLQKAASSDHKVTIFSFWGQLAKRLHSLQFMFLFAFLLWDFEFSFN